MSERTIRYYRTLGLLDAAPGTYLRSFTEKHRLQLLAIRIYQAQGIPLRRIHEHLYGKSEAELRKFVAEVALHLSKAADPMAPLTPSEHWGVVPLATDLLLISRQGRPLPQALVLQLQTVLADAGWPCGSTTKTD